MMKSKAIASLLLLIPAPSVGVLFGMILFPGTPIGKGLFLFTKIWLLAMPALWFFLVEKGLPTPGKTGRGGYAVGLTSGLLISVFVVGAALLLGKSLIDGDFFKEMMHEVGLDSKKRYIGAAVYWVVVNSVLEEYVWRWFVVRQFEQVLGRIGGIVASAFCFTLHHYLVMQVYFSTTVAALCALFVFLGGVWWSWMYVRYKTIWPGWLSHALVDLAVFGTGYGLIFG
ncbi:CPBP family intramembrane glutamic endopeptidase [Pontiella sp.]|uniref:CPBP family intramembrane glutamic endopeptidase n=1 Tax=Pontiella sp. TaxID=2837462 RepID=UPI0035681760